jgi:Fe2+ or Zn2+ uptake regulation protein
MRRQDETLLRDHGLRVTRPRLAVLGALRALPAHCSAAVIETAAQKRLTPLSTQAVYDILHAFHDASIVRRIEPAGSPARYELRVADNHHHVICRVCGATADVDCVVGEAPCLSPSDASNFEIDEAEVIFWGRCATCRAADGQA